MTNKKFDIAVVVGRFQPVHNAHVELLKRAGNLASKVVVVLGSSRLPRTYKNPWVDRERAAMLIEAIDPLKKITKSEFTYEYVVDTMYNDQAWAVRVQQIVNKIAKATDKVAIIGHEKDESSFYLKLFPQWELVSQPLIEPLNASQIREVYFNPSTCNLNWFKGVLPNSTISYLRWFKDSPEYEQVVREKEFIETYKKQFEHLKFAPIFVTTDAVVIQSGHVLMVKRGAEPGKGLLAFPGGFVNATTDKSIEDAMIRELKEETNIKVPEKVLRGSIKNSHVFDAINRSARGRTITHAFLIVLEDGEWNLPKIKGGDDAESAKWIPISQVRSEECFEDHWEILQFFLGS